MHAQVKILKTTQSGTALIILLVILVMGATTFLLSSLSSSALNNARQEKTAAALAQGKEALISYAINSENTGKSTARPGNFPCPDTDAPDTAGYGDEQSSCSTSGGTTTGRLPWKTLGIPELLDGDGEPLWYAVSDSFRKSATRINSDTRGTLLVYEHDGSTLFTSAGNEAVAIVFSPGSVIGTQQRNTTFDKKAVANYLESLNGRNNATIGGPFIAASKNSLFNDGLMMIKTRDFMPIIEKRVAKELQTLLNNYYTDNGVYPYPVTFSSCKDNLTCTSNTNLCRGRFPYTALPVDWGGSYSLPSTADGSPWFAANRWYLVVYYSAGTARLATAPPGCSATLNISGNSTPALFFMPGTPTGGVTRTYPNNNLSWYLEDIENQNMDDNYAAPTANSNDHLHTLP